MGFLRTLPSVTGPLLQAMVDSVICFGGMIKVCGRRVVRAWIVRNLNPLLYIDTVITGIISIINAYQVFMLLPSRVTMRTSPRGSC